jgi:hypothetical protein
MESGLPAKEKVSAASRSHSTVVPFSTAPVPSLYSRVVAKFYQETESRELEAGPGLEYVEKENDFGEKRKQRPEDLV